MILSVIGCAILQPGSVHHHRGGLPHPVRSSVPLYDHGGHSLFFQDYIHRAGLYKGAALGATAASRYCWPCTLFSKLFPLAEYLPFY
ncbi:MAG: hypothetical protein ACLUJG_08695 [Lawsonibacter sp.]